MVAAAHRGAILISSQALDVLTARELDAVLWHELGHLRAGHNQLKQLAGLVNSISPWFAASKALVTEVERLTEMDADNFAAQRVPRELISATRAKFISA